MESDHLGKNDLNRTLITKGDEQKLVAENIFSEKEGRNSFLVLMVSDTYFPMKSIQTEVEVGMKKAICAILALLMIGSIIGIVPAFADETRDGVTYKKLDYNDILRNPMSNWGVLYVVEGEVLQIFRADEKGAPSGTWLCFRIATKGKADNVVICRIDNNFVNALAVSSIIEGDKVKVYCNCRGKKNFSTVLGGEVSLPIFNFDSDDIEVTEQKKN